MGELSKLKLRGKETVYCPHTDRTVKITKWYNSAKKGDPEDIGNPDVYDLICEEPWKKGTEEITTSNFRKKIGQREINVPCGYDRRCPFLYRAWQDEIRKEKKAAKKKAKAEEKPEKAEEPAEEFEDVPEEAELPEKPYETEELVDDPGDSAEELLKEIEYGEGKSEEGSSKGHFTVDIEATCGPNEEAKTDIERKSREIGKMLAEAHLDSKAESLVWKAAGYAHDGMYKLMMSFLNEAERWTATSEQKDNLIVIRANVEELYRLKHGSPQRKL